MYQFQALLYSIADQIQIYSAEDSSAWDAWLNMKAITRMASKGISRGDDEASDSDDETTFDMMLKNYSEYSDSEYNPSEDSDEEPLEYDSDASVSSDAAENTAESEEEESSEDNEDESIEEDEDSDEDDGDEHWN